MCVEVMSLDYFINHNKKTVWNNLMFLVYIKAVFNLINMQYIFKCIFLEVNKMLKLFQIYRLKWMFK